MKKISFNKNWCFKLEKQLDAFNTFAFDKYSDASGAAAINYDYNNWDKIDLPHDWAVALPKNILANTFAGARANTRFHRFMTERHSDINDIYNVGWYRKQFLPDTDWEGKRIFIEFEGIFRDSCIWVNGSYMDRHNSGYTSFIIELTDHLRFGEENSIAVRVDSEQAEGWWYEGSGIYRNVNILIGEPVFFEYNKTVIKTKLDGNVNVSAVLKNDTENDFSAVVEYSIIDADNNVVANSQTIADIRGYKSGNINACLKIDDPKLWSGETPYLYTLVIKTVNEVFEERFGIRTVGFDANRGFLLNGIPCKIRGACVHQDFGGVGVALTDNLNYYKIKRLKDMGVNAYRCSHHAPSPALLRACDELGMLVMDETRMFGTSNEAIRQLTDLIERDRNHPCVFMWSLGNEEVSIQNIEFSSHLMKKASRIAKELDDTRPVTYGGNNGAKYIGINSASEIRGINYIMSKEAWTDTYHEEHPNQPMIGTEESSYVLSRGGGVNDLGSGLLDSTGNVTMSWGSTPKGWVKYFEERPYLAGSFMWTGFDYRGEPNPFITTNVASSFGTIDLCGMEKPPFYYYKAWWTDETVLKLAPHWNYREGDIVTISVFTNCEKITLFINGRAVESKDVERFDAPLFEIPFEKGILSVEGIRNGNVYHDELITSGSTESIKCIPVLIGKSEFDTGIYQIEAFDKNGNYNPLADDVVEISVNGGEIVGVGNGDPACLDYEQKSIEEECMYIRTLSYEKGLYSVPMKTPNKLWRRYDWLERDEKRNGLEDDFRIVAKYKTNFAEPQTFTFSTTVKNVSNYEYIEFERLGGKATVYLNGIEIGNNITPQGRMPVNNVRPYRFYGDFKDGDNEIKIVSVQEENDDAAISGYVKIGRTVNDTPWSVRLHYGKARIFTRSADPENLLLNIKLLNN